jgi:putative iron-regulated protein
MPERRTRARFARWTKAALLAAVTVGCSNDAEIEALKTEVVANYSEIVFASYQDALAGARELERVIAEFVAAPTAEGLDAAKEAWLAARELYGPTEAYRFYGGPIDDADGPEMSINTWPLDESYVDYVEGNPEGGIVNDTVSYPEITADVLLSLNQSGSEENVSLGFHAIEFLLWGQDLSEDGPGARPYTDFVPGIGVNAERRGEYLRVAAEMLVDDLEGVVESWDPANPDSYRAELAALPADQGVQRMLVGVGVLSKSELAGERIFTAYDNQDQEDEHSCFSDNTHRDIALNAEGISNVIRGAYVRADGTLIEGPGLDDLLEAVNPGEAAELSSLLDRSLLAVAAIPAPFDRAIVDPASRPLVLEAVYALQDQGDKIAEVGTLLGLTINTALPE